MTTVGVGAMTTMDLGAMTTMDLGAMTTMDLGAMTTRTHPMALRTAISLKLHRTFPQMASNSILMVVGSGRARFSRSKPIRHH
ncbi:MAG: hypothetical protein IPL62_08560 [Caulobacteraceae bacterium]|nr:hypothetical protein [Caulobacteraceae bacterium]